MILIVDDELENRSSLTEALKRLSWPCLAVASAEEALRELRDRPEIKLLITDLKMPEMNGLELLQTARLLRPDVNRLLVTAYGTIEDTVAAMKAGAFDVLTKPLKLKSLKETIERLIGPPGGPDVTSGRFSPNQAPNQAGARYSEVLELLRRAAGSDASVLFLGESGVGKSHLAHLLHQWSPRNAGPFVALNCAAIPAELLESELFGYERGAFTGAHQSRDGKIQAASGGTLLLDEIGDLSPALQAKLLQFIQEKSYFRLGSNKRITADVRIVSATNQPLDTLVKESHFREDLLYRLRVVEILIPPLRERSEDLLWLIPALLDRLAEKNRLQPVRLTQEALGLLLRHEWPGNVRELENVLEATLVLCPREILQSGFIGPEYLPARLKSELESRSAPLQKIPDLATLERNTIRHTLALTGGNRRLTAKLLGISERTLYRVLEPEKGPDKGA